MTTFGTLLPDDQFFFNLETADSNAPIEQEMTAYPLTPIFRFGPGAVGYVQAGRQTLVLSKDQRSLLVWIEKALRTPRGTYVIYGDDYGTDFALQIGKRSFSELKMGLQDDLERCLLMHPLILQVKDVRLEQLSSDSAVIYMTIYDKLAGETRLVVTL